MNSLDQKSARTLWNNAGGTFRKCVAILLSASLLPITAAAENSDLPDALTQTAVSSPSQNKAVSGTVRNAAGDPIPGVAVTVVGGSQGVITDASGDQSIISNEAGAAGFMVRNNSNQLQFYIYDADINNWNGGGCCTIELNKWYHIAATYQAGGKMVFYLDGVQVSSVNCGTLAASASDLQLGTSPYYSDRYMRGDIQQVSIWDDVRTAAEVAADVACDFDGTEEGLMAYWPLTLNVGTEITDQTGNHVASLVDVTWLDVD